MKRILIVVIWLIACGAALCRPIVDGEADSLFKLRLVVLDEESLQQLDSVQVKVFNKEDDSLVGILISHKRGVAETYLNVGTNYKLTFKWLQHAFNYVYLPRTKEISANGLSVNDTVRLQKLERIIDYALPPVYFSYNSFSISDTGLLDTIAQVLNEMPKTYKLEILGNSDCRGAREANMLLSRKRAGAVAEYFIAHGIRKERITAIGYGDLYSINECDCHSTPPANCSDEKYALNRCVIFRITDPGK